MRKFFTLIAVVFSFVLAPSPAHSQESLASIGISVRGPFVEVGSDEGEAKKQALESYIARCKKVKEQITDQMGEHFEFAESCDDYVVRVFYMEFRPRSVRNGYIQHGIYDVEEVTDGSAFGIDRASYTKLGFQVASLIKFYHSYKEELRTINLSPESSGAKYSWNAASLTDAINSIQSKAVDYCEKSSRQLIETFAERAFAVSCSEGPKLTFGHDYFNYESEVKDSNIYASIGATAYVLPK